MLTVADVARVCVTRVIRVYFLDWYVLDCDFTDSKVRVISVVGEHYTRSGGGGRREVVILVVYLALSSVCLLHITSQRLSIRIARYVVRHYRREQYRREKNSTFYKYVGEKPLSITQCNSEPICRILQREPHMKQALKYKRFLSWWILNSRSSETAVTILISLSNLIYINITCFHFYSLTVLLRFIDLTFPAHIDCLFSFSSQFSNSHK